jgi:hypothetical protein
MNIAAEITPLFLLGTLAFLGWGFWRARRRGSLAVWVWLQGSLLLLPWVVFLGLLLLGIYLNFAGFLLLLLVFTGLYIAVGRKTRQLAQQELQARREQLARLEEQGEAPSAGEAPLEAPAVLQRISAEDLQAIQSIFGLDTFFVTETVPYGEGAIFKGNLRQEAEVVVPLLVEKLKEQVGSRYQLFLVEDPAEKPAVVVLPDEIVNYRASRGAQILAAGLLLASFLATLEVGANLLGFRLLDAPGRWVEALPVAAGIFAILLVHETGHRWMAGKYGVRLSPAFVIPSLGIGTLGIPKPHPIAGAQPQGPLRHCLCRPGSERDPVAAGALGWPEALRLRGSVCAHGDLPQLHPGGHPSAAGAGIPVAGGAGSHSSFCCRGLDWPGNHRLEPAAGRAAGRGSHCAGGVRAEDGGPRHLHHPDCLGGGGHQQRLGPLLGAADPVHRPRARASTAG